MSKASEIIPTAMVEMSYDVICPSCLVPEELSKERVSKKIKTISCWFCTEPMNIDWQSAEETMSEAMKKQG